MALTFRPTQPADFPQCFDLSHDRFLYKDAKSKAELFKFWRDILDRRWAFSTVVEDEERPKDKKIVGFCLYLNATDDFAREAQTSLPPYLPLQVLQRWKKGHKKGPFMDRKALARQNAQAGVNFMTLHYGVEAKETFEQEMGVRGKIIESCMVLYGGFRINQNLHEVYSAREKEIMLQVGCQLRRDYAEFPDLLRQAGDKRPFLMGFDRVEGTKKPSAVGHVLLFSPPRFGFSEGEQDVLEKALWVEIDKDIALALGLTVWAIKKRWQGIYAKVEKLDPSILGPMGNKTDEEYQKTRRQFLLNYLRTHQEELRPYAPGPAPRQKSKKP